MSARTADNLRFRDNSVGVEVDEEGGTDGFVEAVTVLKGKRAWTSFLPTGEILEGLFFMVVLVRGITGGPGTRMLRRLPRRRLWSEDALDYKIRHKQISIANTNRKYATTNKNTEKRTDLLDVVSFLTREMALKKSSI